MVNRNQRSRETRTSISPGGEAVVQPAGSDAAAIYSSHPIAKFKMGRFQFDRGVLRLNAEDSAEFDEQLAKQPVSIRNRIKKSTQADADRIARSFLQSRKTQGIDTTANSIGSGTGEAGSHANPMHPGASKDKLTDGNAEPEFGDNDKIDPFDGDMERRVERNTPVQMADQVAGINSAGDLGATGATVAEDETARNAVGRVDEAVDESQERSQEAAARTRETEAKEEAPAAVETDKPAKPLFGVGKQANHADKNPDA